jgi:hypothetical protein
MINSMVISQEGRVFILENYFVNKSEASSCVHPNKKSSKLHNNIQLVKKFRLTGSVCNRKHVSPVTVLTHNMAWLKKHLTSMQVFKETVKGV